MFDLNETKLTGNLAADLVTTTVTNSEGQETTVTRGRLLRSNSYKNRETGEWIKSPLMGFDFEVWGKYGETLATKARKGTALYIEAAWTPNHFETEEGKKINALRLRLNRWQILAQPGERRATQNEPEAAPKARRSRTAANAAA